MHTLGRSSHANVSFHQGIRSLRFVFKMLTCLWKLIVQVSVVLRKTVGGSDTTLRMNKKIDVLYFDMVNKKFHLFIV